MDSQKVYPKSNKAIINQMKNRVIKAIFSAIDDINKQLPKEERLEKSLETALFGKSGNLDSLGIVAMIVAVEQKIRGEFSVPIVLVNERIMSQKNNPFQTVDSLVEYVVVLLKEKYDEHKKI